MYAIQPKVGRQPASQIAVHSTLYMYTSYSHLTRVGSIDVEKLFSFITQRWHCQTNIQNIFTCFKRSVNSHYTYKEHTLARFNVILKEIERDDTWINENKLGSCHESATQKAWKWWSFQKLEYFRSYRVNCSNAAFLHADEMAMNPDYSHAFKWGLNVNW